MCCKWIKQDDCTFFSGRNFSGGSKNIASQTTVPFFPAVIFLVVIGVRILTQTPIMVLTTVKKYYRKKRYSRLAGYFFGGFKLQPEKITTGEKKVQLSGPRWK